MAVLLTGISVATFVGSAVAVPWFVARIPEDYFVRDPPKRAPLGARVLKNLLGLILLVAGALMLVLPGQGILTLLAAALLLDFPGKRSLELRLLRAPRVGQAINALRRRANRPPLRFPP